ncbi:PAS domain-containing protein [Sphingomonas sp. 2R-10]|uniref:PAS domain-containing protein n=1 Tax=Sphingomonas sp. 2R-10 TaxID=3045148 RepID=UPI000F796AC5|nr:PAS domain-containing protein [Sphingomonas sp. 2R-10]MDJ0278510.1 PAS domain-containing protein [Sphingomonas sp. 2R-10]
MGSHDVDSTGRNDTQHPTVSSADFARRFGQLRQMQDDQAIFVTHHGRATHVLTTVRHYTDLHGSGSNRRSDVALAPSLHDLADCLTTGVLLIDYDLKVLAANRVAHAQLERGDHDLLGNHIFTAVPTLHGSLIETYVQRSVASKEPYSAEIPSLFRPDTWVRVDIHPFARYVTILFHDITDDMKRHRLADARESLREAIGLHDGVGYVCLSTRGHIDRVEPTFCDMVRLSEDRLHHVAMADLVPVAHRVRFRETLDQVSSGGGARTIDSALLSNDGAAVEVRVTIAELRSVYGNEGAIVLLTRK